MIDGKQYGFPEGSKLRFINERTDGVYVCPKCGMFLGFPKHRGSVIIPQERPVCPRCIVSPLPIDGTPYGVLKYAPKTGKTIGELYIPVPDGWQIYVATARCNTCDTYNAQTGREVVAERLLDQLKCL